MLKLAVQCCWYVCKNGAFIHNLKDRAMAKIEVLWAHPFTWGYGLVQPIIEHLLENRFGEYENLMTKQILAVADMVKTFPSLPRVYLNCRTADLRSPLISSLIDNLLKNQCAAHRRW